MIDEKNYNYILQLQRFEQKLNWELSSVDFLKFIEIYEMTQGQTVCTSCKSDLSKAKLILTNWKNDLINQYNIDISELNSKI